MNSETCCGQLFLAMEEYAIEHHVPIISQDGCQVLNEIVKQRQPKLVLEIGTAIGYSTLQMAIRMPTNAKIITIELDLARAAVAQEFIAKAGLADRIEIICGDAGERLPLLTGVFDMVFIDAAKGQYLAYLRKIMDKLSPDAVIVADNVLFRGMVTGHVEVPRRYRTIVKRLREYLDFVNDKSTFDTTVYQTGDGLAVSRYKAKGSEE